jgi:radical SAM superfamily enzyme YgiQ (UPF0313 family)
MRRRRPAYVGMGEEAVSCAEGLRLASLAKSCGAKVLAGGCFFSHVAPEVLGTGLVDVVVHGEGEATIVELVQALRDQKQDDLGRVAGISFWSEGEIVHTPPRPLIPDLDSLPFPAYDLLPVEHYGHGSRNHARLAAIELSRGCLGSCEFCILWRQMGWVQGAQLVPHLRTKTPARLLEEIQMLVQRFDRRYLGWVDPCFNADAQVPGQLAELMLRENLCLGQSAWVRTDCIIRDAESGALASCVRAGLNEVYLGIERADAASLQELNKSIDPAEVRQALRLLAHDYPQVFTVGSFIYGLPGDTPQSVRDLYRVSLELDLDKAFFIPLTPLPGTPYWRPDLWDPTGQRLRRFNFLPAAHWNGANRALERALLIAFALDWTSARIRGYLRGLFHRDARKRRLTRRLMVRGLRYTIRRAVHVALNQQSNGGLRLPRWYES